MKKILISLLLLANLMTGLAFALDAHPEAVAGHDVSVIELMSDSDSDPADADADQGHSDHFCHSTAHMLGLIFNQSTPFVASHHDGFVGLSQAPVLLYIAPLLRPPIV